MIAPKTSKRQLAWELTLYCLTRSKRLHQESKADSTSLSRVMAAVANQVHSTAQQIGARSGWNPIDAATQPPTATTRSWRPCHSSPITGEDEIPTQGRDWSSAANFACFWNESCIKRRDLCL